MRVRAYPDRTNGTNVHESTCSAPRCHQPCPDGYLCKTCTDTARDSLRDLAGHPGADREGPGRTAPRLAGPWRAVPGPDSDTPHDPRSGHGTIHARDRGLLADLETMMAREDVADPDTARPAEEPDWEDQPRTKDRPIGASPAPANLYPGEVLREIHRDLHRWTRALVVQRHGAELARARARRSARRTGAAACSSRASARLQLPDGRDPRDLALWLDRHLGDLRQWREAGDVVVALARHRRRADDTVSGQDVEYLGRCTECWDEREREVHLYGNPREDLVYCPRCGCGYTSAEMRRWVLSKVRDEWADAPTVHRGLVEYVNDLRRTHNLTERDLPWNADVVRGMGRHGRVERRDPTKAERETGVRTQARYRVGEVMDLVAETAEKKRAAIDRRGARAS